MNLGKKYLACHFNGHFVGCFIYADDITFLFPSRYALNNMLDVCSEYAEAYDILFNANKTKCMFFYRTYSTLFDKDVQFMGSPICFVYKCKFLGFSISRDILNRDIQSSISTFNRECNEVRFDLSILNSEIKSKLISIFRMDLYGCSLWNFVQIMLKHFIRPGGNYHSEHIANFCMVYMTHFLLV